MCTGSRTQVRDPATFGTTRSEGTRDPSAPGARGERESGVARHVVIEPASSVIARLGDRTGWLTGDEVARHARKRPGPGADEFLAAHLLVREVVGKLLDVAPDAVVVEQRCERCGAPHGRPSVSSHPGVQVSWAHAGGVVACAAADVPVAIDLEPLERPRGVPALALHPNELGLDEAGRLERWCRKECLVKLGLATRSRFASIDATDGCLGVAFERPGAPEFVVCVLATPSGPDRT